MNLQEDFCSQELYELLIDKGFEIDCYDAPFTQRLVTHQFAMKWLRGVYNVIIMIDYNEDEDCEDNERFGFTIYQKNIRKVDLATYPTYEEAVEAALRYCLTKII